MAAARGLRETDDGTEPIADPEERKQTRKLARRVILYALVTAILATGMFAFAVGPLA